MLITVPGTPPLSVACGALRSPSGANLTIEGAETDALLGATETIAKCRPVIGLEDRRSQHYWRFGYKQGPSKMLIKDFGYKRIASYHLDVILAPSEQQPVGNDIEIVTIPPKENT